MKKLTILLATIVILATISTLTLTVSALEQGAYTAFAGSNYWNPDTGEIDDGGTANAALGDGMSRSVTGTTALVEREGDSYYVTIRLLLQSSTYDAEFWIRTDYNTYQPVSYDMMAENAVTDSIDYRFAVEDPFQPIKASMYVIPMGRATVWYIELDETTISSDTEDFIVTVQTAEILPSEDGTPEILVESHEEEYLQLEETVEGMDVTQEDGMDIEEDSPVEAYEDLELEEAVEENQLQQQQEEQSTSDDVQEDEKNDDSFGTWIVAVTALAILSVVIAVVLGRKRAKRG